jgi:hypothetical protein
MQEATATGRGDCRGGNGSRHRPEGVETPVLDDLLHTDVRLAQLRELVPEKDHLLLGAAGPIDRLRDLNGDLLELPNQRSVRILQLWRRYCYASPDPDVVELNEFAHTPTDEVVADLEVAPPVGGTYLRLTDADLFGGDAYHHPRRSVLHVPGIGTLCAPLKAKFALLGLARIGAEGRTIHRSS